MSALGEFHYTGVGGGARLLERLAERGLAAFALSRGRSLLLRLAPGGLPRESNAFGVKHIPLGRGGHRRRPLSLGALVVFEAGF